MIRLGLGLYVTVDMPVEYIMSSHQSVQLHVDMIRNGTVIKLNKLKSRQELITENMTVKPVDQFNIQITYLNKKYKKDKYIPIICILIHC